MIKLRTARLCSALTLGACGGDADPDGHEFSADTLPDGSIVAYNSGQGLWNADPEARWSVVERVRIGSRDGVGPDVFGSVRSVVVDDLDRMWVVDEQANELRVFNADGQYVRTIGRTGEGPSEFMRVGPAFHGPQGTIWVEDLGLVRWEVFDTAGTRVEGHRSPSMLRGGWRQWTRDGLFLVMEPHPDGAEVAVLGVYQRTGDGVLEPQGRYLELPPEPSTPVITLESGLFSTELPIPFAPQPWGAYGPDLDFWFSDGAAEDGSYEIVQASLETGNALLTIRRRFAPVKIPDSLRAAALEALREEAGDADPAAVAALTPDIVPRHYPPFDDFHLSTDGSLWVRRMFADGLRGFDVFAWDGRYLGRPQVQPGLAEMRIQSITATDIYAIDTDEFGVNRVARLEIERPPGSVAEMKERPVRRLAEQTAGDAKEARADSGPTSHGSSAVSPGPAFRDCVACPEVVVIPAGSFTMGSPDRERGRDEDEGPQRTVTIDYSFAVGVYEVTFSEWDACRQAGGCTGNVPGDEGWGRDDRPVINVNWIDAQSYVEWLSAQTGEHYRLPSEAEWEYVARAGTETARFWGETPEEQCGYANGYDETGNEELDLGWVPAPCADGHSYTAPVGSFAPSAFGVYDIMGNVWEWTLDCWNAGYRRAPRDGSARESGDCSMSVIRGGSWKHLVRFLRSAGLRFPRDRELKNKTAGFRVVRTIPAPISE